MESRIHITRIVKRDGGIVEFDPSKITEAIRKAFIATRGGMGEVAQQLSNEVVETLENRFKKKTPTVENVQDIVEEVLIRKGYSDIAKAYILYRQKRSEIREAKKFFGVKDELKLTVNAISVLQRRYLRKDEEGKVIETPAQMFRRVAKAVASVDYLYGRDVKKSEEEFYGLMANLEFLPNSPTLMNAGTRLGQLSACFVIPVEDSMASIFEAVKNMAIIHKSGGGTGFSFSKLRPRGDVVRSTKGIASGPVSFMRAFDTATDVIKQGGRRRGANMGILRVDHPDILEFITAKTKENFLTNFNISVAVTDRFMKALENKEEYDLINPRTKKTAQKLRAADVFDLIATMAWKTGDPGLVFIDRINRFNPTPAIGQIESTNPCGEQPLLPNESCNLGSINLLKMLENNDVNYEKLKKTINIAVHFLDNIVDANKYSFKAIERVTKSNRKIGLGIMGFADVLIKLGIPYNSSKAVSFAEHFMKLFSNEAIQASARLAEERGSFPNFKGSIWQKRGYKAMRNATVTTIAPTGTISIVAGTTSGIEPLFAVSFVRNVMEGTRLIEVNPLFEEMAKRKQIYSKELMMEIAKTGSIQNVEGIPGDLKRLFLTTFDISPEWHVKIQAAFQKYTDNGVSKTINFTHDTSVEEVKRAFILAHRLGCKGITVYRYGSKKEQVLYVGSVLGRESGETFEYTSADPEYSGGCPSPVCD